MSVALIDIGIANLGSIRRAIELLDHETTIAQKPETIDSADRIILPGVGNFNAAMRRLKEANLAEVIKSKAKQGYPILGICLGMQLLADCGTEGANASGLGLINGSIKHLHDLKCQERVPHVGWNSVSFSENSQLGFGIQKNSDFYFVHSYAFEAQNSSNVLATCSYGIEFTCVVGNDNVMGTQFHPEKSSKNGLVLLENFLDI